LAPDGAAHGVLLLALQEHAIFRLKRTTGPRDPARTLSKR
jgi:hypothetical protein